jgi:phosphinothricin acetyltransferase
MAEVTVGRARRSDLPKLTEIYNYYVENTAITFDVTTFTNEGRVQWFDEHAATGRYRLLVARDRGEVVGYAATGRFRPKAAYDTTVETSIYCAPDATGRGIGTLLYRALFVAIASEDIHRIVAGITLPNNASVALHRRFGFKQVGIYSENGRKFGQYWDVLWMERPLVLRLT